MLRIQSLRLEHNLSKRELAEKINCSQKAIDLWERGVSEPSVYFLTALADCFECTTDYLLGREDDLGNINITTTLTQEEKKTLTLFAKLDSRQKNEVYNYAEYILSKKTSK